MRYMTTFKMIASDITATLASEGGVCCIGLPRPGAYPAQREEGGVTMLCNLFTECKWSER